MSFSSEVKEELAGRLDSARHCRIAFLASIFRLTGFQEETAAGIRTENRYTAAAFEACLKKVLPIDAENTKEQGQTIVKESGKQQTQNTQNESGNSAKGRASIRETAVFGRENRDALLQLMKDPKILLQKTCCRKAYLRGAFLTAGSVSDPAKGYHFEIVLSSEKDAEMLASLMESLGFGARISQRKSRRIVYLKDGEQISDVLGAMGATNSLMKLENVRILRDIAGTVNRQVNCETANLQKTVSAAGRQREDILYLKDTIGLDSLPQSLQQAARLRLEMPDASLQELSECFDPPIGRSGINHRLRRLSETANKIRNQKEKDL